MTRRISHSRSRQTGTFAIELALVGVFMAICMAFISDMAGKQTLQGHLQRLSYSAVNIIKERTQLYSGDSNITAGQVDALYEIVSNSMARGMSGFDEQNLGMVVEQLKYDSDWSLDTNPDAKTDTVIAKGFNCNLNSGSLLDSISQLHFDSNWGSIPAIYQVFLCYRDNNWFGHAIGEDNDFVMVRSHSIMLGR